MGSPKKSDNKILQIIERQLFIKMSDSILAVSHVEFTRVRI